MTRVQLTYQGYDSHHLPEMTDLWVASWQKSYPDIDFEQRRAWAVERFVALNAGGVAYLLAFDKVNADMAGFLTLDRRNGHIDQVVVAIPYWGRGVADQLLTEARRQRPQGLKLEVNTDNAAAIALYIRHGFKKVGEGVNANSGRTFAYMEWPGEPA
jgi:putative acetyltransferase